MVAVNLICRSSASKMLFTFKTTENECKKCETKLNNNKFSFTLRRRNLFKSKNKIKISQTCCFAPWPHVNSKYWFLHVSRVRFPDPASYVGWVCCWFSPQLRGFFSGFSGFPPSSKINISKVQFDREFEGHGFVSRRLLCATLVKQSQFIYLFIHAKSKAWVFADCFCNHFNARGFSSRSKTWIRLWSNDAHCHFLFLKSWKLL